MTDPVRDVHPIDLTEAELEQLRPWAGLFDMLARQVPADRPYTAEEFINWLVLERRARSSDYQRARHADERASRRLVRQLRVVAG